MLKFFALLACLLLSACFMVGPNYKEPKNRIASHWPVKDASVKETPFVKAKWWEVFHDPVLTSLIYQGYQNNISIQSAGVKILQARAQLAKTTGSLYPQQQAVIGSYNYNRIGGGEFQTVLPPSFDTALFGFTATWELDFWGKYRRAILSNNAAFLASFAAFDYALVTLTSDIASTYIKIRTVEKKIVVTKENIQVQMVAFQIAKARYQAGQTGLVDVEQAQAELAETQAKLPSFVNELQKQKDALAVLLGTVPNGANPLLHKGHGIPKPPFTVAAGIPRDTLANRPDIYQAREEAIAQSEAIGAVKANLYPSFSLTGTFIFSSNNIDGNSINDLFEWQNRAMTAGPSMNWPLLNYGQITNAVRVQDATFQQAVLKYMNLVLKAQQDVQDTISSYIEAKKAEMYLTRACKAAKETLKLTIIRYKEGETDFTPVLNAEQQVLRIQLSLTSAQGDIPQAVVALYRALGGGWQIRQGNDIVSNDIKTEMAKRTNWGSLLKPNEHWPPVTKAQELKQLYLPKW